MLGSGIPVTQVTPVLTPNVTSVSDEALPSLYAQTSILNSNFSLPMRAQERRCIREAHQGILLRAFLPPPVGGAFVWLTMLWGY